MAEGDIVAATTSGELVVVRDGQRGDVLARWDSAEFLTAVSVSADRTRVVVGVRADACTSRVEMIDVATGTRTPVADQAASPALSRDGASVAYWRLELQEDSCVRAALVVRQLSTGDEQSFAGRQVGGTPPVVILNWSADGTQITFVVVQRPPSVRILRPASDRDLSVAQAVTESDYVSPVFGANDRLIVQQGCCVGTMTLVNADGAGGPLASLEAPIESIRLSSDGQRLVLVDALHRLLVVTPGNLSVVGDGYVAAA